MNILSPNMLKTFEQCPQKYNLKYVENLMLVQNSKFFEKGKKIHALASYYLQGCDITKFENALNDKEMATWQVLKNNKYFQMQVVGTEYNLSCKVDKYWIGGRLDALVHDEKSYYILDYKTGQIPQNAETDFQTVTYLLCVDKFLNNKGGHESLKFVYLGLKENEEKVIELTRENKKIFEEKIIKACQKLDLKVFTKNKKMCEFCEYKKLCN